MNIQIDYYKLFFEKIMGDGNIISKNQELVLIKRDINDDTLFFETYNNNCKQLFWAHSKEVYFVGSYLENWSEEKINERNCYING